MDLIPGTRITHYLRIFNCKHCQYRLWTLEANTKLGVYFLNCPECETVYRLEIKQVGYKKGGSHDFINRIGSDNPDNRYCGP